MQTITTIGFDIAKSIFQVHGVDAEGKVLLRRQLKRRYVLAFFQKLPPCLVGIESGGVHIRPHMAHRCVYCAGASCRLSGSCGHRAERGTKRIGSE
jgi:hypothetical protein